MVTHRVVERSFLLCVFGSVLCASSALADPSLTPRGGSVRCELIGLGAINTVPYNFPGLSAAEVERERRSWSIVENTLPAGGNPALPAIFGTDLGAPFLHGNALYFTFGDAWFTSANRTNATGTVVNDDLLASVDLTHVEASAACLSLTVPTDPTNGEALPITWNGPANQGGRALGSGQVPGPGFTTGRYMFLLAAVDAQTCGETNGDCAAANGLASDMCLPTSDGAKRCYFGACAASDPSSPCALRLNPSKLIVQRTATDFGDPEVGVHISSAHVSDAYRGHFATVSFFSQVDADSGEGKVWVIGRDSFWGAPGLTMTPYLMFHPVHQGRLDEPLFYAGMQDGRPTFSPNASDARPIYEESELLNHHTSFGFEPTLDGGTWLLLYGGHAQPALHDVLASYVHPVDNALFYDRDAGVYLRTAKNPWGPWSEPLTIWNPFTSGQGGYCEQMYFDDPQGNTGFTCPAGSEEHNASLNRAVGLGMGGEYGAALVPGYNQSDDGSFTLRWLLSTWNPYRVVVFETKFETQ